jgi:t-SNARE syntaxin family protein
MDPFNEVLADAQNQQQSLSDLLGKLTQVTEEHSTDFQNNLQELHETIQDLKESVDSTRAEPELFGLTAQEITSRAGIVAKLEESYSNLETQWESKRNVAGSASTTNAFKRFEEGKQPGEDAEGEEQHIQHSQRLQQEYIREQDQHLDGVYTSMQTINQQARAMGSELEEQAYIMEDLESDLDRVGTKVGRGLKRVEHVIRANQERASDCCIGLLIVALIVLLVLVVIV